MTPDELVGLAIDVAEEGLIAGELPTTPDMPFSHPPKLIGGIRRAQCRAQFARYADTARESGFQRWAHTLADLPE